MSNRNGQSVECNACDELMRERDEAVEMADKLAEKIARLESIDIGEHSSGNDPWQNALDGVSQEAD
jgi:N6-adenosine-specific RNA methylase IME4